MDPATAQLTAPTVSTTQLATTTALRSYLVARRVASRGRRSFPPDNHSSRIRLARPSPLGPQGQTTTLRSVSGPAKVGEPDAVDELDDDEEGWSSDDDDQGAAAAEAGTAPSSSGSDDLDLAVVKHAKARKFVKGVGRMSFLAGSPSSHRRRRTPSASPRKEMTSAVGSHQARHAHPAASLAASTPVSSPSKALRATSTPYTPIAARSIITSNHAFVPTSPEFVPGGPAGSFSPESTTSGSFQHGQHHPSPTSSQSSFSLVTPAIQQQEMFDTSIDSIIIVHDRPLISDKFAKGPLPAPTPLSPLAKPFVATAKRTTPTAVAHKTGTAASMHSPEARARVGISQTVQELDAHSSPFSAAPSKTMVEKRGSPEKAGLMREIIHAATPSMAAAAAEREEVTAKMVKMIMKQPVVYGPQRAPVKGASIAVMVGPESLPYARNPS